MSVRQFALGASGSPGTEFGFYAYILKEKRGNIWRTLKTKSGSVPRCVSALHAISSGVLFGLGEGPQASRFPPEQPLEQSNFLFLTHILYEFGLLVEVLGELENNCIRALFVGFRISLHLLYYGVMSVLSFICPLAFFR